MTRTWLALATGMLFLIFSKHLPYLQKYRTPMEGVKIRFFSEPDLSSNPIFYKVTSDELLIDYEFCNFYQVILRKPDGEEFKVNLHKQSEDILEYNLILRHTEDFKKRDCENKQANSSQPKNTNKSILPDGLRLQGIENIGKYSPSGKRIAPPPPLPANSESEEGHHQSAPGGGR